MLAIGVVTNGASISTALLSPNDRVARLPLRFWAERLILNLQHTYATIREPRRFAENLAAIGNNAGLVAASRGDTEAALKSAELQIRWLGRLARRSRESSLAAFAVQPWVNLGRLDAISGRTMEALDRFSELWRSALNGHVHIGTLRLGEGDWAAIVPTRDHFLTFVHTIYVSDSLKAMILNRRFDLVDPFSLQVGAKGRLKSMCDEACIVAESKTGDHRKAIARAETAVASATGWPAVVLQLRLAEANACAGELDGSRKILSQLADMIQHVSVKIMAKPELMQITARLAVACCEVELFHDGITVAENVLKGAQSVQDEMIQLDMLEILANFAEQEQANSWREKLSELKAGTDYARFRRGLAAQPSSLFDELYSCLANAYT